VHTGFVGEGMLDAAVPGAIFSSPTAGQLEAATRVADRGRGVVHIIKNYTGDVLNFGIAAELAPLLIDPVADALELGEGDRVILIVNGLGSTHPLELSVMFGEAADRLAARGVEVARSLVGSYVTALDLGGCSITAVRADDELLELWDDAEAACDRVDGAAARAWAGAFLDTGGTSGPLYGMWFRALARAASGDSIGLHALAAGAADGVATVQRLGRAEVGDKTMVDAMVPAAQALAAAGDLREGDLRPARARELCRRRRARGARPRRGDRRPVLRKCPDWR
jgi:dihydroxyacetone kinase